MKELYFLGHYQRTEFRGETLYEVSIRKNRGPMRAAICVVLKFPQMDELVDRAGVALEIAN